MLLTTLFILTTILAASFFTAENLISTLVGLVVSLGVTQWLKNQTGLYGTAAAILAFAIAIFVAIAAVVVSSFFSGEGISWETIPQAALQIFALATIAYKTLMADAPAPE